jgi:hypothetical protein
MTCRLVYTEEYIQIAIPLKASESVLLPFLFFYFNFTCSGVTQLHFGHYLSI